MTIPFRFSLFKLLLILLSAISLTSADDRQIEVTISNDSSSAVQIYWQIGADFQATPKNFRSYRALAAGDSISFPSNFGQTWLVFEPRSRRAVGMLRASFRQRQLTVTERDIRAVQGRGYSARFHNRTDRTIAVYLTVGDRELPHSTIAPGRVAVQGTWANQQWQFRDFETDRELRSFIAPAANAEVVIESVRDGRRRRPFRDDDSISEILIDNRASRPIIFWFEGQRKRNLIEAYKFDTVRLDADRPWFVADQSTGRYLALGSGAPSSRRVTITEEDFAPAFARSVDVTLRNYDDEPAYAYPMLGRDELPGILLGAGELRNVESYEGQRWEFRSRDGGRKLGSYDCSASEPSAAIGRPRFQKYRGKIDFTIENQRRHSIDVSVDHDNHVDLIETVPPLSRAIVQLEAGDQVVLTDHRSKEVLDTARVSLRDPGVVLEAVEREPIPDSRDHDDRRQERPSRLGDLLGDLFNRRR
ncbi:MAG: hypothetical protein R3F19_33605 [Verrucomicrobiales bacterium]